MSSFSYCWFGSVSPVIAHHGCSQPLLTSATVRTQYIDWCSGSTPSSFIPTLNPFLLYGKDWYYNEKEQFQYFWNYKRERISLQAKEQWFLFINHCKVSFVFLKIQWKRENDCLKTTLIPERLKTWENVRKFKKLAKRLIKGKKVTWFTLNFFH